MANLQMHEALRVALKLALTIFRLNMWWKGTWP